VTPQVGQFSGARRRTQWRPSGPLVPAGLGPLCSALRT